MATHYKADGTVAQVGPPDGRAAFTLEELQAFVGGYIEAVPFYYDGARPSATRLLLVNEDGLLKRLPLNPAASVLAGQLVVGDALLLTKAEMG